MCLSCLIKSESSMITCVGKYNISKLSNWQIKEKKTHLSFRCLITKFWFLYYENTPQKSSMGKDEENNFNNWDHNTPAFKKGLCWAVLWELVGIRKEIKAFVYMDTILSPKMSPPAATHRNQTLKTYSVQLHLQWTRSIETLFKRMYNVDSLPYNYTFTIRCIWL